VSSSHSQWRPAHSWFESRFSQLQTQRCNMKLSRMAAFNLCDEVMQLVPCSSVIIRSTVLMTVFASYSCSCCLQSCVYGTWIAEVEPVKTAAAIAVRLLRASIVSFDLPDVLIYNIFL